MEFKTKYSVSDSVWIMHSNAPEQVAIWSVEPTSVPGRDKSVVTNNWYRLSEKGRLYHESVLFETKEALIQSL